MLSDLLKRSGARTVLHAGAHHAEEADVYDAAGVDRVLWVEADSAQVPRLQGVLLGRGPRHELLHTALDEAPGAVMLNKYTVSGTNSILDRTKLVEQSYSGEPIELTGFEVVQAVTVDSLGEQFDLLALDVQGAEARVLRGAARTLERVRAVYVEVTLLPHYEGQATFEELRSLLREFRVTGEHYEGRHWTNLEFERCS